MDVAALLAQLAPWRARQQRLAWRPLVIDGEHSDIISQFGGAPWLPHGEQWPICGICQTALTFFLQLDLGQLPADLDRRFGDGLLQLFYCTECNQMEPFSKAHLARIIAPTGVTRASLPPDAIEDFPPKAIVGWEEFIELPQPWEFETLGLRYTYEYPADVIRIECPEVGLIAERPADQGIADEIASAADGDKLAGWPRWRQYDDYPACPQCGAQMQLLFQLDSEDHLPVVLGDLGTGYLTQCPQHTAIPAFSWDCS